MAKRGGFPGGMPGNMANLMKQAQRMQRQMEEQQKEISDKEFCGTAGGGAVTVCMNGKKEVTKVTIDKDACDPEDVETLEDLVKIAVNDVLTKIDEASGAAMSKFAGGGIGGF